MLKTNPNAINFLVGGKKEMAWIQKHGYLNAAAGNRLWSTNTRIELLRHELYGALGQISTVDEFDVLIEQGNTSIIKQAVKFYSPNKASVLKLLAQPWVLDVVKSCPSICEAVNVSDILEVFGNNPSNVDNHAWKIANFLVNAKPNRWAKPFIDELLKLEDKHLAKMENRLTIYCQAAFFKGMDISFALPSLYKHKSVLFDYIVDNPNKYGNFASYFRAVFRQLIPALKPIEGLDFKKVASWDFLEDEKNAYKMLAAGYERIVEYPVIAREFADCIRGIKGKINNNMFETLLHSLILAGSATDHAAETLLEYATDADARQECYAKIVRSENLGTLYRHFPFTNWKCVEEALRVMIRNNKLPIGRLGELTEEMQSKALYLMEEKAEIEYVEKHDQSIWGKGRKKKCATAAGELAFLKKFYLSEYNDRQKIGKEYVNDYGVYDETFTLLLCEKGMESILWNIAWKHGISKAQYLEVLQSQYSTFLIDDKQYIKEKKTSKESK